ncbi:glycoside hydrolase family 3 C-terminal domain-containing protein [Flavobacterium sp. MAH-1]|uniref:beta-glucosidase n=1 Tax=Flavobacterium agri TaxID=2743471 RepID=A0A7Y8Y0Q9_9FLAO|nr:glycoside hydrolase family 3 N-terminal domain-containing protein [Flavobacterium agri]NUY80441.1 glycoside hydrolase family 3 C-terminal domain-containing protein [Flavobacterium agri]NYA70466.1 glycoside hydrolase family 3 C-terminal domain-containing protein [Flavobacterium agri]
MKKRISLLFLLLSVSGISQQKSIDQKINELLAKMTLEEKVGQLNQYTGDNTVTGPLTINPNKKEEIKAGKIGSMLNILGSEYTRQYQELAMQSRLKIPLLFGLDVIHGYKTTFPIPLAEAASWDMAAIELSARVAARESAASGIHWTFAPMVDIARDPRWGRVMEGAGEDTYLGSKIAYARVKGFQGNKLGDLNSVMACAKHFLAYGAAIGGRDYNSTDISERALWETYLPPFKAALDAGAATFMNSFNDINGIPATGNRRIQRDILKGKWNFQGFVVSDWGSIGEMVNHGYSQDKKAAAYSAITAGSDMDMESNSYRYNLEQLVKEGKVSESLIDDAVKRILRKKFELGLFDDPYRYSDAKRQQKELNNPENTKAAREVAAKSIVLLKNEKNVLPLSKDAKTIAFIGPMVKLKRANHGFWAVDLKDVDSTYIVSQWEGMQRKVGKNTRLLYAKGCGITDTSKAGFKEAVDVANQADVVVLSVGERPDMSGEAKSRSTINLPGVQEDLIKELQKTGKPIVVLVNAGRPLVFNWTADNMPTIVYTWWLGSEAGNAIADVLFGDYNPSGKLPMSFPRAEGQIPIYYNHMSTGRPAKNEDDKMYVSAYIDLQNSPKFPFGYGLSYTSFKYSDMVMSKSKMSKNETLEVSVTVANTGKVAGEEVVQLYLRDKFASVVRPVKELKGFQKIKLAPGESKTVAFVIDNEKLSFYHEDLEFKSEAGEFDVMIGSSSEDIRCKGGFELID